MNMIHFLLHPAVPNVKNSTERGVTATVYSNN
jgi:hypothetical protein